MHFLMLGENQCPRETALFWRFGVVPPALYATLIWNCQICGRCLQWIWHTDILIHRFGSVCLFSIQGRVWKMSGKFLPFTKKTYDLPPPAHTDTFNFSLSLASIDFMSFSAGRSNLFGYLSSIKNGCLGNYPKKLWGWIWAPSRTLELKFKPCSF